MTGAPARNWLIALAWAIVLVVAGILEGETVATIERVGLVGARPPLPALQTGLRVAILIVVLILVRKFRRTLERVTLLVAAAAAGSTALYGIGLRSAWLSAFRLLSHLAAYALIMFLAGWEGRRRAPGPAAAILIRPRTLVNPRELGYTFSWNRKERPS
jgi:hypothetical protein